MTHTAGLLAQPDRVRRSDEKGPAGTPARAAGRCARFRAGLWRRFATTARRSPTLHLVPPASLGVPVFVKRRFPPEASGRALTRAASLVAPGRARMDGAPC